MPRKKTTARSLRLQRMWRDQDGHVSTYKAMCIRHNLSPNYFSQANYNNLAKIGIHPVELNLSLYKGEELVSEFRSVKDLAIYLNYSEPYVSDCIANHDGMIGDFKAYAEWAL